MADSSLV